MHKQSIDTYSLQSVQMDPCLDDSVMFAKKLKKLGVAVSLDVMEGLPHGFLNFSQVGWHCVYLVENTLPLYFKCETSIFSFQYTNVVFIHWRPA